MSHFPWPSCLDLRMETTVDPGQAAFEEHRSFLFSIAYRMLGSAADAEDVIRECYLRWREVPLAEVQSPKSYLAAMVTRMCVNELGSARSRREQYVGFWLPEPIATGASSDPVEMAELLTMAFLVLLESLSPTERAVFLLREAFDYNMEETAAMVGKTPANCRQILHRAREAVSERRPRFEAVASGTRELLAEFGEKLRHGDVNGLLSLLADDVTVYSDGGGRAVAALNPVRGASAVARLLNGAVRKGAAGVEFVLAEVNWQPAFVGYAAGRVHSTAVFDIHDGRINAIYITVNPEKLGHLARQEEET